MNDSMYAGEIEDAKLAILAVGENPDQFKFAVKDNDPNPSRNGIYALTYSVTVTRGNAHPKTYKGGHGMNWSVYFEDDLRAGAFITVIT